jgi:ATP-dependent RNA helicase DOB1
MNSNDLFSFLGGDTEDPDVEQSEEELEDEQSQPQAVMEVEPTVTTSKRDEGSKRKLEGEATVAAVSEQSQLKKPRLASPKPVVVDEFQTEAKREVDASAGLTGASVEAGSRLELRHQASSL